MNTLKIAFRNSFRKNGTNVVKIVSLWIGLTVGLVLIAKIIFELSVDTHYPDHERIYRIFANYSRDNSETGKYDRTPGAIAWGMKHEIPEVENATRFTPLWNTGIYIENKEYVLGDAILADENFFDILYRPMVIGNAKEILNLPMHCLVSKSLAAKTGMEDMIGKTINLEGFRSKPLVIAGIFEDFPENSTVRYDVVIPLKSMSNFQWDGAENWVGNDRYYSYVKLKKGVSPEAIATQVAALLERNTDMEFLEKAGVKIEYSLVNISEVYTKDSGVKQMLLVYGLLAIVLLATSILNYILAAISSLVSRTKEIAVHKCYGAFRTNISKLLFTETLFHLIVALALSAITMLLFEEIIDTLMNTSLQALFAPQILMILTLVCAFILIVTGFLPACLFSKIPVTEAFKKAKESHRKWKTVLIFIEITASTFIVSLLMMVALQYHKLIYTHQGYNHRNLLFMSTFIENPKTRHHIAEELKTLSEVEQVSLCSSLPVWGASGNNIYETGNEKELFNIADLYAVDENFLSVLEIPVMEGTGFIKGQTGYNMMMVSASFVDKMHEIAGWKDGVVNKRIFLSEHGEQTIIGVFADIVLSPSYLYGSDSRPAVIFYDPEGVEPNIFLIRMNKITPEVVEKLYAIFHTFAPEENIVIHNYEEHFMNSFNALKILRTGMLVCSIVTLFITLIGVIGYFHNETNRRRSEIALRKINGATVSNIQGLFLGNILKIAVPAVFVGITTSVIVSKILQRNVVEKVYISLSLYTLCAVCMISIILAVVSLNIYKTSVRNPVESLAKE